MSELYVSKLLSQSLVRSAHKMGISENFPLLKGLESSMQDANVEVIPYETYARLYEYLIESSEDDLFGIHEGEKYNMSALGIVGQIVQVSTTLRDGVEKCCQYFNLISNVLRIELQENSSGYDMKFVLHPNADSDFALASQHMVLSSMAFVMHELEYLTLGKTKPTAISSTYSFKNKKELTRVFQVLVKDNAGENSMRFEIKALNERIAYSDYELLQTLETVACNRLKTWSLKNETLSAGIKELVYTLLNPDLPDIETIASNLNMSERSLQRKLREEGNSYSAIVLEVKKELAIEYLKKDLSIKEITYLMGYSESSAFVNAFKKWFGKSPAKYRLIL